MIESADNEKNMDKETITLLEVLQQSIKNWLRQTVRLEIPSQADGR